MWKEWKQKNREETNSKKTAKQLKCDISPVCSAQLYWVNE